MIADNNDEMTEEKRNRYYHGFSDSQDYIAPGGNAKSFQFLAGANILAGQFVNIKRSHNQVISWDFPFCRA